MKKQRLCIFLCLLFIYGSVGCAGENCKQSLSESAAAEGVTADTTEDFAREDDHMDRRVILCIGDSNTFGFDPNAYDGSRYPEGICWADRLEQYGYEIINQGVNGAMVPQGNALDALITRASAALPADYITVMLGTNDLCSGKTAQETADEMRILLQRLQEAAPNAVLILIAPPRICLEDYPGAQTLLRECIYLARYYRGLAEEFDIFYADSNDWNVEISFDEIHFSEDGHAAFAEGLAELLKNS